MKPNSQLELFSKVTSLDIANFTKHMSVMLKSGIDITEALSTLVEQTKSAKMRKALAQILADTNNGASLSTAMLKHPKIFDQFYISVIKIGEESGTLDANLEYLSDKLHKEDQLKKKIKEALFYPTLVISAALIVGLGISLFILPKMTDLFTSFDMDLPMATRILLGFAGIMKKYNILILIGVVLAVAGFRSLINLKAVRPIWQNFLMHLPIIGPFLITAETAAFCRNFGLMMKSGLPISRALEILQDTTKNFVFKHHIAELQASVDSGKLLGEQLNIIDMLPAMAAKMIAVGEKSGNLNEMLLYLGDYYEEETDGLAKSFSTVLEPVLLLFIGLIVAVIALAVIAPIYQLTGSIKQ